VGESEEVIQHFFLNETVSEGFYHHMQEFSFQYRQSALKNFLNHILQTLFFLSQLAAFDLYLQLLALSRPIICFFKF